MDLEALADFNLVAAHGGFGRAGRISGRSKATLSRHVSELEHGLGVRLIERGSQSLRLTDEGRALHERTDDIPLLVEYFIDRYARKAGKTIRPCQQADARSPALVSVAGHCARAAKRDRAVGDCL